MSITGAPTIHNSAKYGEIAETVIMPGDPLRAKYIAENFLDDAVCFNKVRGMLGFTGTYKGKRVSVMGSGMGIPSMGIYCYELYKFYDVKSIIRIGSCGGYDKELELLDTILVDNSYSESRFAYSFSGETSNIMQASKELTDKIYDTSKNLNINLKRGTIITTEAFDYYMDVKPIFDRMPKDITCIAAEMESFALFHVANVLNKQAACLLSVVDSHTKKTFISPQEREKSLNDMITVALESVI